MFIVTTCASFTTHIPHTLTFSLLFIARNSFLLWKLSYSTTKNILQPNTFIISMKWQFLLLYFFEFCSFFFCLFIQAFHMPHTSSEEYFQKRRVHILLNLRIRLFFSTSPISCFPCSTGQVLMLVLLNIFTE